MICQIRRKRSWVVGLGSCSGASAPMQERASTCPTRAPRVSGERNSIGLRLAPCAVRWSFRSDARKEVSCNRRAACVSTRLSCRWRWFLPPRAVGVSPRRARQACAAFLSSPGAYAPGSPFNRRLTTAARSPPSPRAPKPPRLPRLTPGARPRPRTHDPRRRKPNFARCGSIPRKIHDPGLAKGAGLPGEGEKL